MSLAAGVRLGPYEIHSAIGAGGMGEVWKARDTTLGRDVALKILPDHLALDPDRLARFKREAQILASLNHPNIAAIYGFQQSDGVQALVLELVDGPTLADRIAQGPIAVDEALRIARQIAEALEAAHEQGIIHRDLKPANIKLRSDGTIKVLDFGLARRAATDNAAPVASLSPSLSPTITSPALMTDVGVLLGTAAYMSPEQAKGRAADKRSDLWAFGCVLYEMLTGRRAFPGHDVVDTLAGVLTHEPEWASLPGDTPPAIRRLLRRCLHKDRHRRFDSSADARLEIDDALAAPTGEIGASSAPTATTRRTRERVAWGLAGLSTMALVAAIVAGSYFSRPEEERQVRFEIAMPASSNPFLATISPDGRLVAFVAPAPDGANSILWLRPLDSTAARPLLGTEGAWSPFWSPDSTTIGFSSNGRIKRVNVAGGPPEIVSAVPASMQIEGGTWNDDGTIVFSAWVALYRVTASGGQPAVLTTLDRSRNETGHLFPSFLPDGRHFLYFAHSDDPANGGVYVGALDSPDRTRVRDTNSMTAYADPGYLLFQNAGTLMAQPFDATRLQTTGQPVRIADGIAVAPGGRSAFAVSKSGVLVYRTGEGFSQSGALVQTGQLAWFDRMGKNLGLVGQPLPAAQIALSPDEKRVALSRQDPVSRTLDIWTLELLSGVLTRLTFDPGDDDDPVWSPDGRTVTFWSYRKDRNGFYRRALGGGEDEVLFDSPDSDRFKYLGSMSKDGKFLLYHNGQAIFTLPLIGPQQPKRLFETQFYLDEPHFSPDGQWVAYGSNESGTDEVHVASFPAADRRRQVSAGGGGVPWWRADGKELFYLSLDGKLMSVAVQPGPTPEFGAPKPLFQTPIRIPALNIDQYAITNDGQRFLILSPTQDPTMKPMTVVLNWTAGVTQ